MASTRYAQQAQAEADRLSPGKERRLQNSELRAIFGVSRITAAQRAEIVRALEQAGLEVISGATTQPLIVRNPAAQDTRAAVAKDRPWFKRKRTWAIAAILFFVLVAALPSDPDSPDENASRSAGDTARQTTPTTTTETTPTPAGPTRAEIGDMVDDDHYAEAIAAAALLGNDEESWIARRIANRLARRTMFALSSGDRSRARFLLTKAEDYPSTSMSRKASSAYRLAQARASSRAAARRAEAARIAQAKAAREEAKRAAEAVPDVPDVSAPDASGPSSTNWCGKRDGDGDGIYCEGE